MERERGKDGRKKEIEEKDKVKKTSISSTRNKTRQMLWILRHTIDSISVPT